MRTRMESTHLSAYLLSVAMLHTDRYSIAPPICEPNPMPSNNSQFPDKSRSYSCGASEEILGKAIREIGCPREDVVILTKLYMPVTHGSRAAPPAFPDLDKSGYTNQYGLSRKVRAANVELMTKEWS